jgi:hypothetical protein
MRTVTDDAGPDTLIEPFSEPISVYTRAQAIADGVLIDVSRRAKEAGFAWPVAVTSRVWVDCVAWSEQDSRQQTHQDEAGRLWDLLCMAVFAARGRGRDNLDQVRPFYLFRVPRDGRAYRSSRVQLKMMLGPGDHGEPVVTILMPGED